MKAACDLAQEKNSALSPACTAAITPALPKPCGASTMARLATSFPSRKIPARPYGVTSRNPNHSELEWQCSTQYHFVWLSGDDVVQSLVHNLDRASWALKEQAPVKCHGLGGRSAMFDQTYGNVFDHHPSFTNMRTVCVIRYFAYKQSGKAHSHGMGGVPGSKASNLSELGGANSNNPPRILILLLKFPTGPFYFS